jgi:hypothetical protein
LYKHESRIESQCKVSSGTFIQEQIFSLTKTLAQDLMIQADVTWQIVNLGNTIIEKPLIFMNVDRVIKIKKIHTKRSIYCCSFYTWLE